MSNISLAVEQIDAAASAIYDAETAFQSADAKAKAAESMLTAIIDPLRVKVKIDGADMLAVPYEVRKAVRVAVMNRLTSAKGKRQMSKAAAEKAFNRIYGRIGYHTLKAEGGSTKPKETPEEAAKRLAEAQAKVDALAEKAKKAPLTMAELADAATAAKALLDADKAANDVAKAQANKAKRAADRDLIKEVKEAAADVAKADFLKWCLANRAKLEKVRDGLADVKVKPKSAAVVAANKAHDARITPSSPFGDKLAKAVGNK